MIIDTDQMTYKQWETLVLAIACGANENLPKKFNPYTNPENLSGHVIDAEVQRLINIAKKVLSGQSSLDYYTMKLCESKT